MPLIFKKYAITIVTALTALAPVGLSMVVPQTAFACTSNVANNISLGANDAAGGPAIDNCSATAPTNTLTALATNVVRIFSIVIGAISVIMILYGGFRYITSGGESSKVGNAKSTIIYAIIGLIIVALAQLIVHFVLSTSDQTQNPTAGAGPLGG